MSGQIGKFPLGLTGLLALRDSGRTVQELTSVLSPIVDLSELYAINEITNATYTVAAAALGTNTLVPVAAGQPQVVPPGEVWYVHCLFGNSTVPVGGALRYNIGVRVLGTVGGAMLEQPLQSFAANEIAFVPAGFTGRFLPPGAGLAAVIGNIAAGPFAVNATIVYSVLKG